jgi:hypothetical protein
MPPCIFSVEIFKVSHACGLGDTECGGLTYNAVLRTIQHLIVVIITENGDYASLIVDFRQ